MNRRFYGFAFCAIACGMLVSCTNDLKEGPTTPTPDQTVTGNMLVRNPEITAWSGNTVLNNTRADDPEELAVITQDEIDSVIEAFNAKDNYLPDVGKFLEISDLEKWSNYYVQDVVEGNQLPLEIAQYVGTNNETISNIAIWNIDADEVVKILTTDGYVENEAKIVIEDGIEDGMLVTNHPIKDFSFETTGYDINNTLYQEVRSSGHKGQYEFTPNYRIYQPGNDNIVYVALYGYTNQNNGYWDRIIKITKVNTSVSENENQGGIDGDVIYNDKIMHNNEVEVNLSILDTHEKYSVEDLISKLSIHVRYPRDVRVYIPVPTVNLVPADDLDIVLSHKDLLVSYGEENRATFKIGENVVELMVDFSEVIQDCAGNETEGNFIEVTTKGMNKEVLEYCLKNYGDGVNFEIFNYYQWNVTDEYGFTSRKKPTQEDISEIKCNWFDSSTIEFGYLASDEWNIYVAPSDLPYFYINAFKEEASNSLDCHVKVNDCQDYYENILENMPHLNGSDWNIIYVRDDIFGTDKQDDAHTAHEVKNSVE